MENVTLKKKKKDVTEKFITQDSTEMSYFKVKHVIMHVKCSDSHLFQDMKSLRLLI